MKADLGKKGVDETGNRYGMLTVVSYAGRRGRRLVWNCQCECGRSSVVSGVDLRRGNNKSCGCMQMQTAINAWIDCGKQTREKRAAGVICAYCSREPIPGDTWCQVCRDRSRANAKRIGGNRQKSGLCKCGRARAEGRSTCDTCTVLDRARKARLIASGLCVGCGLPTQDGKRNCAACLGLAKQRRRSLVEEVIAAYGGKCAECGISELVFLNIDHVNDDGAKHRKAVGGERFYDWLKKNNYPAGFQCLCCNHNMGKRRVIETVDEAKTYGRKSLAKLKRDTFAAYGGKCQCCGEEEVRFLTIDHVNNDGGKHRRETGVKAGHPFYRWLRSRNYPEGYTCLCYNCNFGRARNGLICPHSQRADTLGP